MRLFRSDWMRDVVRTPQRRSFLWGAGAALTAYFLWPALREAVRPCAKGVIRGAMVAGDRFRYAMASAREGVEDVIAEAQFERMRDVAEPDAGESPEAQVGAQAGRAPAARREH